MWRPEESVTANSVHTGDALAAQTASVALSAQTAGDALSAHAQDAVVWHNVEWHLILGFALVWEIVYQASKRLCARRFTRWPKVRNLGGSYLTAFLNALVCSIAGLWIALCLLDADVHERSLPMTDGPHRAPGRVAYLAAQSFCGWLAMDLVHLATHYPALGGLDMLLHHAGFGAVALMGSGFRYCPWVVGWLMLGETSSLFLNVRWGLINTGRGDSLALTRTNYAFALTFFVFRVVVFWGGLWHIFTRERPHLLAPPHAAPPWSVDVLCAALVCGAALNAFWFAKIVRMALKPPPASKTASECSALHSPKRLSSCPSLSDVSDAEAMSPV